jgi:arylsulfatase A-like enzyme
MYRDLPVQEPAQGDWSSSFDDLPYRVKLLSNEQTGALVRGRRHELELALRAYYATVTHIDHQIRVVLGYLREAGLIDTTIIVFTSDHGHMVGDHGLWCMTPFYEASARIPLIVVPPKGAEWLTPGSVDDRIAEFGDIMPTVLELAGIPVPDHVDCRSLVDGDSREYLYGEFNEGADAMRMIREGDHKLIYYPVGNRVQLFDLARDPRESKDLAELPKCAEIRGRLIDRLVGELYGDDLQWVTDGKLVGLPDRPYRPEPERTLKGQRGLRFM